MNLPVISRERRESHPVIDGDNLLTANLKALSQLELLVERFTVETSLAEILLDPFEEVQMTLIELSAYLISRCNDEERQHTSPTLPPLRDRNEQVAQVLVLLNSIGWSCISGSYKCLELLCNMTYCLKNTWLSCTTGGPLVTEPYKICHSSFDFFYSTTETILTFIKSIIKQLNKNLPEQNSLKQSALRKFLGLEKNYNELSQEKEKSKTQFV